MTDPRRLYEQWLYQLWTSGEPETAARLVTPDFVGHWPGQDVHGPADLASTVQQSLRLFSGVTTAIEVGPVVDGDLVAARWRFQGAYAGGIPGATVPVGTPITLRGADLLRYAGDRFQEYWVSSDALELMAALGAV